MPPPHTPRYTPVIVAVHASYRLVEEDPSFISYCE